MATKELIDYIKSELEKGVSEAVIKTNLVNTGWNHEDIEQAFAALTGSVQQNQTLVVSSDEVQNSNSNIQELRGGFDLFAKAWGIFIKRIKVFFIISILPLAVIIIPLILFGLSFGLFKAPNSSNLTTNLTSNLSSGNLVVFVIGVLLIILISAVVQMWSQTAMLFAIVGSEEGIGVKESYKRAWGKINSYFWIVFLLSLISLGGFILFFIPGIIFILWFSFSSFVFIAEDIKGMNALLKSREYVRGRWWQLAGRFFVGGLIFLAAWLVTIFLNFIPFAGSILSWIFLLLLAPFVSTYIFLVYKDFKRVKGEFEFVPKKKGLLIAVGVFGILLFFVSIFATVALTVNNVLSSNGSEFLFSLIKNMPKPGTPDTVELSKKAGFTVILPKAVPEGFSYSVSGILPGPPYASGGQVGIGMKNELGQEIILLEFIPKDQEAIDFVDWVGRVYSKGYSRQVKINNFNGYISTRISDNKEGKSIDWFDGTRVMTLIFIPPQNFSDQEIINFASSLSNDF